MSEEQFAKAPFGSGAGQLPPELQHELTPALKRLVGEGQAVFAQQVWGRKPMLYTAAQRQHTHNKGSLTDLFNQDAVDDLISTRGLTASDITMTKHGATIPSYRISSPDEYVQGAEDIDSGKVLSEFCDGAAINFPSIERLWPALRKFGQQLHADLGHPVRCSAHTTGPGTQDRSDTYRVHDLFVLQITGTSTWRVAEPLIVDPLPSQPWHEHTSGLADHLQQSTAMTLTLAENDVLYLPRGYLYRTETGAEVATAVQCAVSVWNAGTIADLVVNSVRAKIADTPALRSSMPLAPDLADPVTLGSFVNGVQQTLQQLLEEIDPVHIAGEFLSTQRRATKPESVSAIHTAVTSSSLTLNTELVLRGGINAVWERPGLLTGQPGVFIVDDEDEPHVNLLLRDGKVHAKDLSADAARALEMARRLIRGGWVRVS